jgi:hypothetical protein
MSSIFGVPFLKKAIYEQMLIWIIVSYIGFITVKQQEVVQFFFHQVTFAFSDGKGETPIRKKNDSFAVQFLYRVIS